jgi:hypothetical protein
MPRHRAVTCAQFSSMNVTFAACAADRRKRPT